MNEVLTQVRRRLDMPLTVTPCPSAPSTPHSVSGAGKPAPPASVEAFSPNGDNDKVS